MRNIFKRRERIIEKEKLVYVQPPQLTVILPMKQVGRDTSDYTYMYVHGWNDAMQRVATLISQARCGTYEPQAELGNVRA